MTEFVPSLTRRALTTVTSLVIVAVMVACRNGTTDKFMLQKLQDMITFGFILPSSVKLLVMDKVTATTSYIFEFNKFDSWERE